MSAWEQFFFVSSIMGGMYLPLFTDWLWEHRYTYRKWKKYKQTDIRIGEYRFVLWRDSAHTIIYFHFQVYYTSSRLVKFYKENKK